MASNAQRLRVTITGDARQLNDTLDGTVDRGRSWGAAFTKVIAGAGAAAGAALVAGFVNHLSMDKANDHLAASLDLTEAESQRAGEVAGGLYADAYGSSIEEVNSALAGLHTNIGDLADFTDAELEDMGAKALDLAAIMGEDVSRVTRGVGQLMRNGMAPDAEAAFDMIAAAQAGLSQDMKGELLDTIEEYSADMSSLGLDGTEALGMLSAAVDAGARNVDLAADALREFSIRAVDGSTSTAEAFQRLGMDSDDLAQRIAAGGPTARTAMSEVVRALGGVGDKVAQEQIGVALFGTRFEELGMDAVGAMDPVAGALDDVGGAAERMGDTLNDNAATKIEAFKRGALMRLTNFIGGTVIPAGEKVVSWLRRELAPAFDALSAWWQSNGPAVVARAREFGAGVAAAVQVIGGWITGTLLPAFARIVAWWQSDGQQVVARVQAFAAGVGAALQAAAAVVTSVVQTIVGWFQTTSGEASATTSKVSALWAQIQATTQTVFSAVAAVISTVVSHIRTAIQVFVTVVKAVWERWGADILAFAQGTFNNIVDFLSGIFRIIKGVFDVFAGLFTGDWSRVWTGIKDVFGGIWQAITALLSQVFNTLRLYLTVFLDVVREVWNRAWTAVKDFVVARFNDVVGFVRALPGRARDALAAAWGIYKAFWTLVFTQVKDFVGDRVTDVVEFFKALPGRIIESIADIGGRIRRFVGRELETVKTRVGEKIDDVVGFFRDLPGRLLDALGNLGSRIADKFSFSLPGINFSGEGDGPGAVPGAGGHALTRARALSTGLPIRMTNSYRSPAHNARVGGSPTSYHMDAGNPASDWVGPTWALDEFAARLRRAGGWREVLWRVPNHAPGDNPHVHVAHGGGHVTPTGIAPLRPDELDTRLQVGETVLPKGAHLGGGAGMQRLLTLVEQQNRLLVQLLAAADRGDTPAVFQVNGRELARVVGGDVQEELRVRSEHP